MKTKNQGVLTREEWKSLAAYENTWFYEAVFGGLQDGRDPRHVHAAVALHNQPFGFTREDVRILNVAQLVATAEDAGLASDTLAYRLKNLANRIEALLPPEDLEV